jgi:hypothetical protein
MDVYLNYIGQFEVPCDTEADDGDEEKRAM